MNTHDSRTPRPDDHSASDGELIAVLEYYLKEAESGRIKSRTDFIRRYPSLKDELEACLPAIELLLTCRENEVIRSSVRALSSELNENAVLGDFRIGRRIGEGGMGIVFEGEQISLGRRVAVKILPHFECKNEQLLRRFNNESFAAAQLDHPNIVPVYSVGHEQGIHFFAMRLIEGVNLAQVIEANRRKATIDDAAFVDPTHRGHRSDNEADPPRISSEFAPDPPNPCSSRDACSVAGWALGEERFRWIAELGAAVADALEHAHESGVVHRDIKPSNLLVDYHGHIWVTDFGLARIADVPSLTMSGGAVGTLRYMSPEQALGQLSCVDHRTDIYSLGATMYELLTHYPAVTGKTHQEVLARIAHDVPIEPRRRDSAIPRDLETIVMKAMSNEPSQRYPSAAAMAADCRRFLGQRPILARRPSIFDNFQKWTNRNRSLATALAISGLTIVGILIWSTLRISRIEADKLRQRLAQERVQLIQSRNAQRQLEYTLDLKNVDMAWRIGDEDLAQRILDKHLPKNPESDVRGFEWHLFKQHLDGTRRARRTTWQAHAGRIYEMAFSHRGELLGTVGDDATAKLWDASTLELRHTLNGHNGDVNCLAFSPNDREVITGGDDGTVRLWSAETGDQRLLWAAHMPYSKGGAFNVCVRVGYSFDGQFVYSSDRVSTKIWNVQTGELLGTLRGGYGRCARSSHQIATVVNDAEIWLWDMLTLQQTVTLKAPDRVRLELRDMSLYAVDDLIMIGTTAGYLEEFTRVDADWVHRRLAVERTAIDAIDLSRDRRMVAVGLWNGKVRVLDRQTGDYLGGPYPLTTVPPERVWSIRFTPDGQRVVAAGRGGSPVVWDSISNQSLQRWDRMVWHRTDFVSATSDDQALTKAGVNLYATSVAKERQVQHFNSAAEYANCVSYSHTGVVAMATHGEVRVWQSVGEIRAETQPWIATVSSYPDWPNVELTHFIDLLPSGEQLAFANAHETYVYDIRVNRRETPAPRFGLRAPLTELQISVAACPDGKHIAVGGSSGGVCVFKVPEQTTAEWHRCHSTPITTLIYTPDGQFVIAGSSQDDVAVWNPKNQKVESTFETHVGAIRSLTVSPDSHTLAVVGKKSNVIQLWSVPTARQLCTLYLPPAFHAAAACFSPKGKALVVLANSVDDISPSSSVFAWRVADHSF